MNKERIHDLGSSMDASFQEDASSLQLSLPESIDDSLTLEGFPVIPNHGSSAEARLYFAQLEESIRKIERLEQEQRDCLDDIQNGRAPSDDEFEHIRSKHSHELTFQELFWKIVYDAISRHKGQYDIQQNIKISNCSNNNKGLEQFDAQTKIQELQSTLLEIKDKYLLTDAEKSAEKYDLQLQTLKRDNEELRHEYEKSQRAVVESKSSSLELERKIQILEKENSSLVKEKEHYIIEFNRIDEDCKRKEVELHETKTQIEHLGEYSMMKLQSSGIKEIPASSHFTWLNGKEDILRPMKRKLNQILCELHERNIDYAKLELLHDERGKQVKNYQSQVDMLQEQIIVLKREFENLEKESLMERKRLNDDILRRDEQLEMYLESKMSYVELPQKDEATSSPFQSPSRLKTIQGYGECCHCRHVLAHTVDLGKKCKELQFKINELETRNIQQVASAENNATSIQYKSIIRSLEGQVVDLRKKNDAMRLEDERMFIGERQSILKQNSSKNHAFHHIFVSPQQKISEYEMSEHDARDIHLKYRGPGSFRVKP